MDTKKDAMIPQCGNLTDGSFVVGAKQLRKMLIALCESCGVAYDLRYTMQELGKICGIEVGAAAAASVKQD